VLRWVTVCGRVNHLGIYNPPPRSTQPFILPEYINRVPACLAWVKAECVYLGWMVGNTVMMMTWHVKAPSSEILLTAMHDLSLILFKDEDDKDKNKGNDDDDNTGKMSISFQAE